MSKKGQLWTREEENDVLDKIRNGRSFDAIARESGRTAKAIEYRMAMHCQKEMMKGKELSSLAREFHQDPSMIQQIMDQLSATANANTSTRRIDDDIREIKEQIDKIYRLVMKIAKHQKRNAKD